MSLLEMVVGKSSNKSKKGVQTGPSSTCGQQ